MCEVFGSVKNDGFTSKVRGVREDQYEERGGQVDPRSVHSCLEVFCLKLTWPMAKL